MRPLNGTKTHPLSAVAKERLRDISRGATPCQEINPGVANRLERESLVETIGFPSPYKTHKGKMIPHYVITEAGREALSS